MFPNDELSSEIYDAYMHVVSVSKPYFCLLFGHHDTLDQAMSIFLDGGTPALHLMMDIFLSDPPHSDLPQELNPQIRKLLGLPCNGKPATQLMMNCRYSLLLSCGLSVACFRALENGECGKAIVAYGKSEFYLGSCIASGYAIFGRGLAREIATLGAAAKLAKDPKQREKASVRECWDEWQKTPLNRDGTTKYAGKTAFAKDMLTKYESLESVAVISRWCLAWEKELVTQLAE
jgi:hypothetical protein